MTNNSTDITQPQPAEDTLRSLNEELKARLTAKTEELAAVKEALRQEIVQRQKVEAALQENQIQFQRQLAEIETIYHSAPIGLNVLDTELRFVRINERLAEINGFSVEEHIGRKVGELLPDLADAAEQLLRPILETGEPVLNVEITGETPAQPGVQRTWLESFLPLKDGERIIGISTVCQEISEQQAALRERKQAEEKLRKSEYLYRTLAQNLPNGAVSIFDHDLRYLVCDGTEIAKVGFRKEQLEGRTLWEVLPPETSTILEPSYRAALAGETTIFDLSFGNSIYQIHTIPLFNEQGEIFAGLSISQNITLQKQAEQTLRTAKDELERQVQQRTEELKRSNQELEQFAYIASHDLQEPLRAITSFTQMLAKRYQGKLDAKADMYIEFIVDGAIRMQQLVKDLLTYSRTGRYQLKIQTVDCNALLEQVKKDLQIPIAETRASITADPLPTVLADSNQLSNLLLNLISNSLKYRSDLPPKIYIYVKKNTLRLTQQHLSQSFSPLSTSSYEEWIFAIQDNGIGIEPQYSERIFGIFQRLHTSDEYSGTGLGLAICKKIIERHGGRIWVDSQLGQGATFYFTLPIAR